MRILIRKIYFQIKEWKCEGRAWAAFLLGIGICVKDCGTYLMYVNQFGKMTQIFEPFIILGSRIPFLMGIMLGGILLLSDAPFVKPISEYEVLRGGYKQWFVSEVMYVLFASVLYSLVILMCSCIFTAIFSKTFVTNTWSDSLSILAYQQPEYVIRKYAFAFPYPELLDATLPLQVVLETIIFQSLYMSLLGICMLVMNLFTEKNIGWIIAALIHIWGYISYANVGAIIPLKWSPLCCASPAYHYIKEIDMSGKNSFLFMILLIIFLAFIGLKRFQKKGFY